MEAELLIQLVPNGQIVAVNIVRSSGDAAFDRSAELAVKKAGSFPELADMPPAMFERNFRRLRFIFKPEDLRS
jgi:colicin import membrane protein